MILTFARSSGDIQWPFTFILENYKSDLSPQTQGSLLHTWQADTYVQGFRNQIVRLIQDIGVRSFVRNYIAKL